MQLKARLFLLWFIYTLGFVWLTGALTPLDLTRIFLIALGSMLGMLLPKIVTAVSEVYLLPSAGSAASLPRVLKLVWQDAHSLMPVTKVGQLIYSFPFLFGFGAVAFYVVTSSGSWFGKAIVLGMGLRLTTDLFVSNRDKQVLKSRWFSAFQTKLSDTELNVFVYGAVSLFVLLTILALRP